MSSPETPILPKRLILSEEEIRRIDEICAQPPELSPHLLKAISERRSSVRTEAFEAGLSRLHGRTSLAETITDEQEALLDRQTGDIGQSDRGTSS